MSNSEFAVNVGLPVLALPTAILLGLATLSGEILDDRVHDFPLTTEDAIKLVLMQENLTVEALSDGCEGLRDKRKEFAKNIDGVKDDGHYWCEEGRVVDDRTAVIDSAGFTWRYEGMEGDRAQWGREWEVGYLPFVKDYHLLVNPESIAGASGGPK